MKDKKLKDVYMTHVCDKCPFRCKNNMFENSLGLERISKILESDSFVCHKMHLERNKKIQCAGHMLMLKTDNVMYRLLGLEGYQLPTHSAANELYPTKEAMLKAYGKDS